MVGSTLTSVEYRLGLSINTIIFIVVIAIIIKATKKRPYCSIICEHFNFILGIMQPWK